MLCALFAAGAAALTSQEVDDLLHQADGVKSSDPARFTLLLQQLDAGNAVAFAAEGWAYETDAVPSGNHGQYAAGNAAFGGKPR